MVVSYGKLHPLPNGNIIEIMCRVDSSKYHHILHVRCITNVLLYIPLEMTGVATRSSAHA